MNKQFILTDSVKETISETLCAERLRLRLTHREMALKLRIGPKILEKLERKEVKRVQSEDIEAVMSYFGDRLAVEKVQAYKP